MKKLLFVTGTRADYGKLEPLALAAQQSGFSICFFITGMHMMRRYGETRIEVKRFPNADFFEFVNQKEGDALDFVLSKTVLGFSDFVHEHQPDLVIIHGDRIEALATSIVCATRQVRSVHVEGGEVTGSIDESFRHCNTKLCTAHFVSSEAARDRIVSLGENRERVYTIGSPELDAHMRSSGVSIDQVKHHYDINFDEYGVVVFHPVTSEKETIARQTESIYDCLKLSQKNYVVIAPNNDPGSEEIFRVLDSLPSRRFKLIPSMRFSFFSELMKNAAVMIGNSSAGVREAPFIGIPSLDIGSRQNNRSNAASISKCKSFDQEKINAFISNQWGKKYPSDDQFGSGNSAYNFSKVLSKPEFWRIPLQKVFED